MSKPKYANVGGQAVMEGVMMKSPKRTSMAVRNTQGEIVVENVNFESVRKKYKFFALPVIRGAVAFIESLILGYKTLMRSAVIAGLDEETKGNKKEEDFILVISALLGCVFAVGLFIFLPIGIRKGIEMLGHFEFGAFRSLVEGLIKIIILVAYMWLVSRLKDIKRLFQYHGAEHKSIFCFEAGLELTVENVKKQSRLHPRCGTSFLLIVMVVGILVYACFGSVKGGWYILLKLLLLPVIAGVSFEIIQWAGRYENIFTRIVSAPGKMLQKITTAEPDDSQIEVAISALKASLIETDETGNEIIDTVAAFSEE